MSDPLTLVSAMARLRRGPGRGFTFVGRDRQERYFPYEALEAEAWRRAAFIQALGLQKGDRAALVLAEPDEFVLTFLGCVVAGVVPVPIYPRASFKNAAGYVDILAHIITTSGARAVFCLEGNRELVEQTREHGASPEHILDAAKAFEGEAPAFTTPKIAPDDLCFLQFTSGSTSKPKGVMVTHANLVANATAFLGPHGLDRNDDDRGVSWLPLFHDMGLIGFVLGTLVMDIPVVLLPTETFARSPGLWLETITKHRGTITYAPNFAYQLVTRRVKPAQLAELDLSTLRVAGSGAEPIRPATLREFAAHFAPAGFRSSAFLPSYGMAESTLAITFHPVGTEIVVDTVDQAAMKAGRAEPVAPGTPGALEVMSCGRPFPAHELAIVDDEGRPLGERLVGQVVSRGPSVTPGYFENHEATTEALKDGWLQTGDLGYLADGNLYICGRVKDLIIIRGANHYPQDIEWAVSDLEGVRRGNVFAFSVMRDGTEELVIAAEANRGDAERLREEIARKTQQEFGLTPMRVAICPVGTLPKTSSGKAQRRKTKLLFEDGELEEHG
ncbi:MAG: fatty acyl-AMP ligase [Myxococcales bacterium]|nr:fatty acyl-AMP ligase [Myxococcales bacterium]